MKDLKTEHLIEKSNLSHTSVIDNLSYEKTKFVNYATDVIVTCNNKDEHGIIHGDFTIKPSHLMNGQGCPKCRYLKAKLSKRKPFKETLEKIKEIYPDYDYSKSKETYKDRATRMLVICHKTDKEGNEHGEFFMIPNNTLNPYLHCGCPKCGREKSDKTRKLTFDEFLEKANKVHNGFYTYNGNDFEKRGKNTKLKITCPIHGDFYQTMSNHLFGQGCPICKTSKLEKEIISLLNVNSIEFIHEKSFEWLNGKRLDFYLPQHNMAIECQGSQHFLENHFHEPLEIIIKRDEEKRKACEGHGIKLLYYSNLGIKYPYKVFENKEDLLKEILNEEKTCI